MSPFSYDEFKSENVKFETLNHVVEGKILDIERYQAMNGPAPKYTILQADGRRVSLIASQTDLKSKLADVAPQVGDQIRIEYTGTKNVGQPEPMKLFQVGVTSNQTAAAPVAQTVPDSPETQAAAADPPF